ncbi:MAG: BON domain-containing protein [Pseudomonadota bacterium]
MKLFRSFLFIALIASLFVACSKNPQSRAFHDVVKDNLIVAQLHSRLMRESATKDAKVDPVCWRGELLLKGNVTGEDQKQAVLKIAEGVPNVVMVKEQLTIGFDAENREVDMSVDSADVDVESDADSVDENMTQEEGMDAPEEDN